MTLIESVGDARRILIAGGPKCGKTTQAVELAQSLGIPVRHTDDLIGKLEWSAASLEVSTWFADPTPWIIEGVAIPRALRKWFTARPNPPADIVVWLGSPVVPLTSKQRAMGKACATVWREILPAVIRSGMRVQ